MKLKIKKIYYVVVSIFLAASLIVFSGCSKKESAGGISKTGISNNDSVLKNDSLKKIKVVASVYPFYEWAKAVAGDAADVELLIKSGTDLHSFTPSAKDIIKVTGKETDLFIYGGGESDFWIEKLLPKMAESKVVPLNLMKEKKESLIAEEEHHHDEDDCGNCEHEHEHEHETDTDDCEEEFDEHFWMSVIKASEFVDCICEKMCEIDCENSENVNLYRKNAAAYKAELDEIAEKFKAVTEKNVKSENLEKISDRTIIVADRNPFVYFADDFGLNIVAAFHGCSAETEASFETIMHLSHEADEHNVSAIVITETGNDKIAKTVIENCGNKDLKIVTLNAMQGKMKEGQTYLGVMQDNLKVIEGLLK